MARCQAEIVTVMIMVVVAIAALAIVSNIVITDFVKSRQIRGEVIDYSIVVEDTPSTSVGVMKVTIVVSCTGPNCDRYYIDTVTITGYNRTSGDTVTLATDRIGKHLRNGVTKVDVIAYYNSPPQFNELI
ncbi:MAG: hypothetical protein QXE75_04885, partial [Sulfolobales archaeon]